MVRGWLGKNGVEGAEFDLSADGLRDAVAQPIVGIRCPTEGEHPVGAIPDVAIRSITGQVAVGVIRQRDAAGLLCYKLFLLSPS